METITIIQGTNNKARLISNGTEKTLLSYSTKVAKYNEKTKQFFVNGFYSSTTSRHINAFRGLFGLAAISKKEILEIATDF